LKGRLTPAFFYLSGYNTGMTTTSDNLREIYSVSQLNQAVHDLLEASFPLIWVEGEISNLARPSSGHIYFSLKDDSSQVRCAMFRMKNRLLNFQPENGMQILLRARVSLYAPRGDYQLIIEHMEEAGFGALQRAFEALKQKLASEGLFEQTAKQSLPAFPRRIGVVTSPTGAAIRDILHVLQRRFPSLPVIIYPVPVQGDTAAARIASMIELANRRQECDVLILARGGGSLEDLWAFNEEVVARAVYASKIPIVCGVGHETDITIADFTADLRAPTPSAAAELVSPDRMEWLQRLTHMQQRIHSLTMNRLQTRQQRLDNLEKRLQHPGRRLQTISQRLEQTGRLLVAAMNAHLATSRQQLQESRGRLLQNTPLYRIQNSSQRNSALQHRLRRSILARLHAAGQRFTALSHNLHTVSPLATLGRGYAIVRSTDGNILRRASDVVTGDRIQARLATGSLNCLVESIENEDNKQN
jgi:exodeoxyribonuclease VII large subunit